MNYRIHFANMRKEFVSQTLAAICAANKPRNINKTYCCGNKALRMIHLVQYFQSFIGNVDNADIGFNCAERVIRSLCARLGDSVKERALADIGQADNSEFHSFRILS
mgnify:CR=1 FL=1